MRIAEICHRSVCVLAPERPGQQAAGPRPDGLLTERATAQRG